MGSLSYIDPNYDSVQVDVRMAEREPLWPRIKKLMPHCVLTTRPHRKLTNYLRKTKGGIFMPEQHDRMSNEWLLVATVLKTGADVDPDIFPGATVVIPQFSGSPIFDDTELQETSLWFVSDSAIMAVLESDDAKQRSST